MGVGVSAIVCGRVCGFCGVEPGGVLPEGRQELVVPGESIIWREVILGVQRLRVGVVVTERRVEGDLAERCLENAVTDLFFVRDVRLRDLIVSVVGDDVTREDGKGEVAHVEELWHAVKR